MLAKGNSFKINSAYQVMKISGVLAGPLSSIRK